MTNKFILILSLFSLFACSVDNKTGFWSKKKKIIQNSKIEVLFENEKVFNKEFNNNIKINLNNLYQNNTFSNNLTNNSKLLNYDGNLNNVNKFSFSKIKNFNNSNAELLFTKNNEIIFSDGNGTIFKLDKNLKKIWEKNFYKKKEKKLNPSLNFAFYKTKLIVTDNLSYFYSLDLNSGDLIWKKKNSAAFNSQIKVKENKFFVLDFDNVVRCYTTENGQEIWNYKSENTFIKSNKKMSIVIDDNKVFFINSVGDINALNISDGNLIWQAPTQSSSVYEDSFSTIYSDLVIDNDKIFISNNKNNFFVINAKSGAVEWKQNIKSTIRPSIVGNIVITFSSNGFFLILDKNTGNLIRSTSIMPNKKHDDQILGFIIGKNKIYLSLESGVIVKINIKNGLVESINKINKNFISKPYINNKMMYIITNKSIKLYN